MQLYPKSFKEQQFLLSFLEIIKLVSYLVVPVFWGFFFFWEGILTTVTSNLIVSTDED